MIEMQSRKSRWRDLIVPSTSIAFALGIIWSGIVVKLLNPKFSSDFFIFILRGVAVFFPPNLIIFSIILLFLIGKAKRGELLRRPLHIFLWNVVGIVFLTTMIVSILIAVILFPLEKLIRGFFLHIVVIAMFLLYFSLTNSFITKSKIESILLSTVTSILWIFSIMFIIAFILYYPDKIFQFLVLMIIACGIVLITLTVWYNSKRAELRIEIKGEESTALYLTSIIAFVVFLIVVFFYMADIFFKPVVP